LERFVSKTKLRRKIGMPSLPGDRRQPSPRLLSMITAVCAHNESGLMKFFDAGCFAGNPASPLLAPVAPRAIVQPQSGEKPL
jgi:hypothetical protein